MGKPGVNVDEGVLPCPGKTARFPAGNVLFSILMFSIPEEDNRAVSGEERREEATMLFRLERTPFHRGEKIIKAEPRSIEVLAVLPLAIRADGLVKNAFLCRTNLGLERIDEEQIWDAMKGGQYREAKRRRAGASARR